MQFAMRYNRFSRPLFTALGLGPGRSGVVVDETTLEVSMGYAFKGRVPRTTIRSASYRKGPILDCGVHGWRGTWRVNGAWTELVDIEVDPPVKVTIMGIPMTLRRLTISPERPQELVAALQVG